MVVQLTDNTLFTLLCFIIAIIVLIPHARSWWKTKRFIPGLNGEMICHMFYLSRYTGTLPILILSFIVIGYLMVILIIGFPFPLGLLAIMFSVAIVPILRLSLPPTILFLAGSGDRANALLFRLHLAVNPLRIVTLLDPKQMGVMGLLLRLDIMRTSNENNWKSMVHRLIDIAPIFVVDTVSRTGPVRYEAFLMTAPERIGRVIFLSDENGDCPSLLAEGINPSDHAIPVSLPEDMEEEIFNRLQVVLRYGYKSAHSPIPIVPENWNSLPSLLLISFIDNLDGQLLLTQAKNTDKNLIGITGPFSSLDGTGAKLSIDLSWDFSRNPKLVGLYLEFTGLILVRRTFLLEHPQLLNVSVRGLDPSKLTFEDLNSPDPINSALITLCDEWRIAAQKQGLEFRYVNK